jgi:hypothetical protein
MGDGRLNEVVLDAIDLDDKAIARRRPERQKA